MHKASLITFPLSFLLNFLLNCWTQLNTLQLMHWNVSWILYKLLAIEHSAEISLVSVCARVSICQLFYIVHYVEFNIGLSNLYIKKRNALRFLICLCLCGTGSISEKTAVEGLLLIATPSYKCILHSLSYDPWLHHGWWLPGSPWLRPVAWWPMMGWTGRQEVSRPRERADYCCVPGCRYFS